MPQVLTEVSNLFEKAESRITKIFFSFLAQRIIALHEVTEKSSTLVQHRLFVNFGLVDSAVAHGCDNGLLVLTADLRLYGAISKSGTDAINFNHLRMFLL